MAASTGEGSTTGASYTTVSIREDQNIASLNIAPHHPSPPQRARLVEARPEWRYELKPSVQINVPYSALRYLCIILRLSDGFTTLSKAVVSESALRSSRRQLTYRKRIDIAR